MMAQSALNQDDGHIAAGTTVLSLGILAPQHTDITKLRIGIFFADKKKSQFGGSARMCIQLISIYGNKGCRDNQGDHMDSAYS